MCITYDWNTTLQLLAIFFKKNSLVLRILDTLQQTFMKQPNTKQPDLKQRFGDHTNRCRM